MEAKKKKTKSKKSTRKKTSKTKSSKSEIKIKEKIIPEVKEIEVISIGEDIEEDFDEKDKQNLENSGKWWLDEPWRSLLDPDLAKNVEFSKFDLSKLIEEFTDRMLQEDLIDFRISGLAIYSSAKFYHQKITGVITEEENIQKEEIRKRLRRQIPGTISQPLRESRKIATSDELFGAMRRAIIETMQNREKLRIRRERQVANREKVIVKRGKGKLPAEILKHITGKDETIEERLRRTHNRIKEIIKLEDAVEDTISMKFFKEMIYKNEEKSIFEKKVAYIQRFEELLFLASLNKIIMRQETLRKNIEITLTDKSRIEF